MSSDHSGHTFSVKWRLAVFLPNAALRHFNTLWCCQVFQPWEGTFLPESTVWAVPCLSTDDKYSELHFLEWSEKRKSYSSKTVHFVMHSVRVRWDGPSGARWANRWKLFRLFFLMHFVLFSSSGPLSTAELPGVEFIRRQSCQLSQKSPHCRALRGSLREKSMT